MKNLNKLKVLIFWLIFLTIICFFLFGFDESESNIETENEDNYNIEDLEENYQETNKLLEELMTQSKENILELELAKAKSEKIINILDISLGIAIAFFITILTYFTFNILSPQSEKKVKNLFFNTLLTGLKSGSIKTTDDLINIYNGIKIFSPEDKKYRLRLNNWLREFLVNLVSKNLDNLIEDKKIIEFKTKISKFIKNNEKISPYSDLPKIERSIFYDVLSYIKNKDLESIKLKLKELSNVIQTRIYETDRSKKINKFSVPIAIMGLILTIIFGLIAIFK